MNKIINILFICYGNTCRSPAAEYFAKGLKKKKYNKELKDVNFDSAGWYTFEDAQPETKNYIQAKGINMSDFRPKIITKELIEKQDLIIGMERYHLIKIRNKFKDLIDNNIKDKLYTLKQFNGAEKNDLNIPDPYKTGLKNYNRILKIVEENVEKMVKKLVKINSN